MRSPSSSESWLSEPIRWHRSPPTPQAALTPPIATIFDGEKEAKLIALACSEPPKGRARRKVGATGLFENDEAT